MQPYHDTIVRFDTFVAISDFVRASCEEPGSFEDFEAGLAKRMRALESDIKAEHLARYDIDAQVIQVGEQEMHRCLVKEPKTYLSASGPIVVKRNLFRPSGGGKSVCALELRAGIVGGLCTPVLARQVTYAMGHLTSTETAGLFVELGVQGPSSSTCDRIPKVVSEAWERHREQWDAALRVQETVPGEAVVMAVSLDGVMVPDKDAQREAKAERDKRKKSLAKATGGPAGYREVGCGTVSLFDADGKRLDTVRYGRAPEYKKRTLTTQLDAEVASILETRPDLTLVALADGAEENWRYFDGPTWESATKIVDHGHACQHMKAGLVAYYGADSVNGRAEYERLKVILKDQHGGVDDVITAMLSLERKLREKKAAKRGEALRKERKYFENQRERMAYARYQELGLPIGSGVVEAACKTLATQRMKRSGMSWGGGKQAVLTIRSLQQSDRWQRGWRLLASAFQTAPLVVRTRGLLKTYSQPDFAVAA
ncbi:MAG: hypothetical protein CO108_21805 [Deltaproteobacteria bacterium CG_4_9_14_3_um_filter_63_12]|nr:MAG: hypothetical protein CO108_21805 [Deltaproteobacteria bacterium CG_4_9_14_3_um_filter_63_12]